MTPKYDFMADPDVQAFLAPYQSPPRGGSKIAENIASYQAPQTQQQDQGQAMQGGAGMGKMLLKGKGLLGGGETATTAAPTTGASSTGPYGSGAMLSAPTTTAAPTTAPATAGGAAGGGAAGAAMGVGAIAASAYGGGYWLHRTPAGNKTVRSMSQNPTKWALPVVHGYYKLGKWAGRLGKKIF